MGGAAGYKVYVRPAGQSYGTGTDVGNPAPAGDGSIRHVVNDLPAGATRYFSVSAYDGAGSESVLSNELSLVAPATPSPTSVPPTATNIPPTATNTAPPTSTTTASATATASATGTFTATSTVPPTSTASASATATPTASATRTATATNTPLPTDTATATPTHSATRTASATSTAPPSSTPTASRSATRTRTATRTMTATASTTATATRTATPPATATASTVPSATPTFTPTPTATPIPSRVVSVPADARIMMGSTTTVPVRIGAGSGVQRFAIRIAFDPAVVGVVEARLSSLAAGGDLEVGVDPAGALDLTGTLLAPLTAGGSLVDVELAATGPCRATSALTITACTLDGGAVACAPRDGAVRVRCGLGGRVRTRAASAPVSGTLVSLQGSDGPLATATTDELGQFSFGTAATGTLLVEPQKSGDGRDAVSAFDAAIVLASIAGLRTLDPEQRLACDVTGNGAITTLDAVRILELSVGVLDHLPVAAACGSDWIFVPDPLDLPNQHLIEPVPGETTCQPGGIMLDPAPDDAPEQDFTAILFGDCTGNWLPAAALGAQARRTGDAALRLGAPRRGGGRWVVPLAVAGSAPFQAISARIAYDPGVIVPVGIRAVGPARGALVDQHVAEPGSLTVALAAAAPLPAANRPVLALLFDRLDSRGRPPSLRLLRASLDDATVPIAP